MKSGIVPRSNVTVPQKKTSTPLIKSVVQKITSDLPIKTVIPPTKAVVSSRKPISQQQIQTKPIVQQPFHSSTASINTAMKSSQTGANYFKEQQRQIVKHHREVNDIKIPKIISMMSDFTKLAENHDKGSLPEKIFCSGLGTAAQLQTQKVGMEFTMVATLTSTIYTENPVIGCTVAIGGLVATPVVAEKVGRVAQSQCHQTLDFLKAKLSNDVKTSATKTEETQQFQFNMRK